MTCFRGEYSELHKFLVFPMENTKTDLPSWVLKKLEGRQVVSGDKLARTLEDLSISLPGEVESTEMETLSVSQLEKNDSRSFFKKFFSPLSEPEDRSWLRVRGEKGEIVGWQRPVIKKLPVTQALAVIGDRYDDDIVICVVGDQDGACRKVSLFERLEDARALRVTMGLPFVANPHARPEPSPGVLACYACTSLNNSWDATYCIYCGGGVFALGGYAAQTLADEICI